MAAVDQDRQLHAARTSVIEKRIERCANGASGIQHIVAQHHVPALHVAAGGAGSDYRTHIRCRQVVTIKLNIEHASIYGTLFDTRNQLTQALCQRNSAPLDANESQVFAAITLFNNLMCQAHKRALNLRCGHQPALDAQGRCVCVFAHWFSLAAGLSPDDTRVEGCRASCGEVEGWFRSKAEACAASRKFKSSAALQQFTEGRHTATLHR